MLILKLRKIVQGQNFLFYFVFYFFEIRVDKNFNLSFKMLKANLFYIAARCPYAYCGATLVSPTFAVSSAQCDPR